MNPQAKTEPSVKQAVPFFRVSNIEESLRFYVGGLGFEMAEKWIDKGRLRWCSLHHGGAVLMLQEGNERCVPEGKVGVGVTICFVCEDGLAIYREVTSRGVKARTPFVGNAMWVTSMSEPDGYKISFESYTDTPEETVFSEQEG